MRLTNRTGISDATKLTVNGRNVLEGLSATRIEIVMLPQQAMQLRIDAIPIGDMDLSFLPEGVQINYADTPDKVTRKTIADRLQDAKNAASRWHAQAEERWRDLWKALPG